MSSFSFKSEVLWLLQHLQDSCQALYRSIPALLARRNALACGISEAGMGRRMAKWEDVSSHKEESEDAFPRGDQACVRPSLTCTYIGRLTEIPGPPMQKAHST